MANNDGKIGLILSRQDPAGAGCLELLLEDGYLHEAGANLYENARFRLLAIDGSLLDVTNQELAPLEPVHDLIFLSKHSSESGRRTLTVHTTGNWGKEAKFGGNPEELSLCNPSLMKELFIGLIKRAKGENFEISLEVTHHGPTDLAHSVAFLELGSDKISWNDKKGQKILIDVIRAANLDNKWPAAIGFGGGHYAPAFNKLLLNSNWAIGHICPKYADISKNTIENAIKRTYGCEKALLDEKGLRKEQKQLIISCCENADFPFELI
jgi:D-aminoacyl-tRNA deacylase